MKKLLIIFLLFYPIISFSQRGYFEGYIITFENDTIFGKIMDGEENFFRQENFKKIRFIDSKGEFKKLSAKKIKNYSKTGKSDYKSMKINSRNYFGKVIIDGPVCLLYYTRVSDLGNHSHNIEAHYVQKKDEVKVSLVSPIAFKKRMSKFFSECEDVVERINDRSLNFFQIEEIVKIYNECVLKEI